MSRKYKFHDNDKLYFISFATVHWIDVFVREEYSQIVLDSWKFCQEKKGLEIYGWCIMPSHVHMINKPEDWKCSSAGAFCEPDKYQKGIIELKYSS